MPCGRRVSVPGTRNAIQEIFGRRGVPKIAEGLTILITMVYVQVGGYPAMAPFPTLTPEQARLKYMQSEIQRFEDYQAQVFRASFPQTQPE